MRPSVVILSILLGTSAQAAQATDTRIVTRRYDPHAVVTLAGRVGTQATIGFGEDERIENVAVGDSAMWQVTPNKRANLLFVKPVAARARTNMTVVTDRRTYLFDLVAGAGAAPLYMLRFTYPDAPKPAPVAVAAAEPTPAEPAKPDPSRLNFAWKSEGSKALIPARLFDDGHAVYLGWQADSAMPAILIRDAKGVEGPVNFTVQGDYVVVDEVPGQLLLRAGKEMATLTPLPRPPVRVAAATPSPETSSQ